ncbi:MAG: UDP-2,4-diacetamido-2,4,6-trideoxy-beta-L-altropyranose hydrolase [Alkaliphilus sp.]
MKEKRAMKNIAFRVDGGSNIGIGHIMRCFTLARELKHRGYRVIFISNCNEKVFRLLEGQSDYDEFPINEFLYVKQDEIEYINVDILLKEARIVSEHIKNYKIDVLIIDTYRVTKEYLLALRKNVKKLVYIDDLNKFIYPVDILVNGNITAEHSDYAKYSENELFLLGSEYTLLREEFGSILEKRINKEVKEIMITTGGSDPYNMSVKLLELALADSKLSKLKYNVIVGNVFKNKMEIRNIAYNKPNISLYENVEHISKIMLKSDLAVSASGSTLYELCACGTPTLSFIMAKNQRELAKKMNELSYVELLGCYEEFSQKNWSTQILGLAEDFEKRKRISMRTRKIFDCKGAKRVVSEIDAYFR